jgi:hypothetical protein
VRRPITVSATASVTASVEPWDRWKLLCHSDVP